MNICTFIHRDRGAGTPATPGRHVSRRAPAAAPFGLGTLRPGHRDLGHRDHSRVSCDSRRAP